MLPIRITLPNGFLDEEYRDGYFVSAEQKKLWAVLLDLLVRLDEVCKKNGIRYFIDSGTLLGAVRHKGFIPWDDDLDVVMLREDYERFLALSQDEFGAPYFLQSYKNDCFFTHTHAQLRNSETTAILSKEGEKVLFNQGVFIDIFPLDKTSRFRPVRMVKNFYMKYLYKLLYCAAYGNKIEGSIKRKIGTGIYNVLHNKFRMLYHHYDSLAKNTLFPEAKVAKITLYCSMKKNNMERKRIPEDYFNKVISFDFEGLKFPGPEMWNEILIKYYGSDYMNPKEEPTVHGTTVYNTEKSYKDYFLEKRGHN